MWILLIAVIGLAAATRRSKSKPATPSPSSKSTPAEIKDCVEEVAFFLESHFQAVAEDAVAAKPGTKVFAAAPDPRLQPYVDCVNELLAALKPGEPVIFGCRLSLSSGINDIVSAGDKMVLVGIIEKIAAKSPDLAEAKTAALACLKRLEV